MTELTLVQAVNLALRRAMADDSQVIVLGEDVAIDGGVFRATDSLYQLYGGNHVLDTPLAEGAIAGVSVGPGSRMRQAGLSAYRKRLAAFPSTQWVQPVLGSRSPLTWHAASSAWSSTARVVVQGFGAVGKHAARFLAEKGALLVGASDSNGTLADPAGLEVNALIALKESGRPLRDHPHGRKLDGDAVLDIPCDIRIPAARPDVVRADNVARLNTLLIPQGANIPCTAEAEQALHDRGVLVIPDFIANAGGVICASIEYRGGTRQAAFDYIDERIKANTQAVLEESRRNKILPRAAAMALARTRISAATATRRWR